MALVLRVTPFPLIFGIIIADGVLRWINWQALGTFPIATARICASRVHLVLRALNLAIGT